MHSTQSILYTFPQVLSIPFYFLCVIWSSIKFKRTVNMQTQCTTKTHTICGRTWERSSYRKIAHRLLKISVGQSSKKLFDSSYQLRYNTIYQTTDTFYDPIQAITRRLDLKKNSTAKYFNATIKKTNFFFIVVNSSE